jgi:hypothetical protein
MEESAVDNTAGSTITPRTCHVVIETLSITRRTK